MKTTEVYKRKAPSKDAPVLHAYDDRLVVKLVRNYRSHPDIIHIPNELFYDKELQACANKVVTESLCKWNELPNPGFPLIFHGVIGKDVREERSPSFFNIEEISVVKTYVQNLVECRGVRVLPKEIGIISPYRKQVRLWLVISLVLLTSLSGIIIFFALFLILCYYLTEDIIYQPLSNIQVREIS